MARMHAGSTMQFLRASLSDDLLHHLEIGELTAQTLSLTSETCPAMTQR